MAGDSFDPPEGLGVLEGEAFEDDTDRFARLDGDGLGGFAAVAGNFCGEIARLMQEGVFEVDVRWRGTALRGETEEFRMGPGLACGFPGPAAFVDEAESGTILQEADGTAEADFVGEIVFAGLATHNGLGEFDAELGPGVGVGTSTSCMASGPPGVLTWMHFIELGSPLEDKTVHRRDAETQRKQ